MEGFNIANRLDIFISRVKDSRLPCLFEKRSKAVLERSSEGANQMARGNDRDNEGIKEGNIQLYG